MIKFLRRLVTLLVALSVPATLLVALPQSAAAYTSTKRVTLKGASLMAVKLTSRAVEKNAFNSSFTAMNYGDVDRIFRQYNISAYERYTVDWKRQFATGFYQQGGRINNISNAEMNLIKARRRAVYGSSCPQCRNSDGSAAQPGNLLRTTDGPTASCGTGESKGPITHSPLYANRFKYSVYLNSCQTDLLINNWETCVYNIGGATGLAAVVMAAIKAARKRIPLVTVVAGFLGAVCWHEANGIKRVQMSSNKHAIVIRSNPDAIMHSNPNGGQYADYGYYPQ